MQPVNSGTHVRVFLYLINCDHVTSYRIDTYASAHTHTLCAYSIKPVLTYIYIENLLYFDAIECRMCVCVCVCVGWCWWKSFTYKSIFVTFDYMWYHYHPCHFNNKPIPYDGLVKWLLLQNFYNQSCFHSIPFSMNYTFCHLLSSHSINCSHSKWRLLFTKAEIEFQHWIISKQFISWLSYFFILFCSQHQHINKSLWKKKKTSNKKVDEKVRKSNCTFQELALHINRWTLLFLLLLFFCYNGLHLSFAQYWTNQTHDGTFPSCADVHV